MAILVVLMRSPSVAFAEMRNLGVVKIDSAMAVEIPALNQNLQRRATHEAGPLCSMGATCPFCVEIEEWSTGLNCLANTVSMFFCFFFFC